MILWESYIGGGQSLGVVGEGATLALDALGEEVRIRAWNASRILRRTFFPNEVRAALAGYLWEEQWLESLNPRVQPMVVAGSGKIDVDTERESVGVMWGWIKRLESFYWRHAKVAAGYVFYDYTALARNDVRLCNAMDVMFVPSTFCKEALVSSGVSVPVVVWSHGVDCKLFKPGVGRGGSGPFRFLFVGVAQPRKGLDELLQAFVRAFPENITDVELIVKSSDWGELRPWKQEYGADPRIVWLHETYDRVRLSLLFQEVDCLVVPSRAEAFCLPALEAMACGLPVVFTNHGGHLDFCDQVVGYPVAVTVEPTMRPVLAKLNDYVDTPLWATADVENLALVLRHVYEHPVEAKAKGAQARVRAERWSWEAGSREALMVLRSMCPGVMRGA